MKKDHLKRMKLHIEEPICFSEYLQRLSQLNYQAKNKNASRISARGIVRGRVAVEEISGLDGFNSELTEVNLLPIIHRGEESNYLWVNKNSGTRTLSGEGVKKFLNIVEMKEIIQEKYHQNFAAETDKLFSKAKENKLSISCIDPMGEWGTKRDICKSSFYKMIKNYFLFDDETIDLMLENKGYSDWHYLFAARDFLGNTIGTFVIARWSWGFEATYTMVKDIPDIRRMGIARFMMLCANALVLDRHGPNAFIYGESNTSNLSPCIQSGYQIMKPEYEPEAGIIKNVVLNDNPIGDYSGRVDINTLKKDEGNYRSYVLMTLKNELILPHIKTAYEFLK